MTQATWIDRPEQLPPLAAALGRQRVIGVDTESNSFYAFRERICLLQISTVERDYLVDPLALQDLDPLAPAFADPVVTKVFHDGEQDVVALRRDLGLQVRGLFDTKVARSAMGGEGLGLAALVRERLGIELDKRLQRSNWGQRPLTAEQLEYAALDTKHLIVLHGQLEAELARTDGVAARLARAEFVRLEGLAVPARESAPNGFLRVKGARHLDPLGLRTLRELHRGRQERARELDVPPVKILADEVLFHLAARRPEAATAQALEGAAGLPRRSLRRHVEWVHAALWRSRELGPLTLAEAEGAASRPPDDEELAVLDGLRAWRRQWAEARAVDPSLVLNRAVMEEVARSRPATPAELGRVHGLEEWRCELLGPEILEVVRQGREGAAPRSRRRRGRRRG